ncbi:MAG: FAD-binding oxidoreductase [Chloroflexota bacterium]
MDSRLVKQIIDIAGEEYVSVSSGQDQPTTTLPELAVTPTRVEQVSAVLKLANEHDIPVLVRGQATGIPGENVVLSSGILLDMHLMNRVLEIDEDNMTVVVEAGCSMNRLAYELDKRGFASPIRPWFAPNPQIGGLLGNNGVGNFSLRFGRFGDQTNGLEVVIPTGEVVKIGAWGFKDISVAYTRHSGGPGLVGLFTASAGTLGVITKVALRIVKKRRNQWYRTFGWSRHKLDDMARFLYELPGYDVSTYQLQNYWCSRGAIKAGLVDWPAKSLGMADDDLIIADLIQVEETEDLLEAKARAITQLSEKHHATDLGPELCRRFHGPPWYAILLGQCCRYHPGMLAPDEAGADGMDFIELYYVHPVLDLGPFWHSFEDIVTKWGFADEKRGPVMYIWGLEPYNVVSHPTFGYRPEIPEEVVRFRKCYQDIYDDVRRLRGLPYNIGSYLPASFFSYQAGAINLMKKVKQGLDPNNILNRGQLR